MSNLNYTLQILANSEEPSLHTFLDKSMKRKRMSWPLKNKEKEVKVTKSFSLDSLYVKVNACHMQLQANNIIQSTLYL